MTIISLDFDTLSVASPATPPSGYLKPAGSDPAAILNTVPKLFGKSSGANSIWYNTTPLTGDVIEVEVTLPSPVSSDSAGGVFLDSSMNGLMWVTGTGTNNFRIFAVVNGQLSGSPLFTQATAPIASAVIVFRRTINAGNDEYELFQNGVKLGSTYTNNSYNVEFGGVNSRGGAIRAMAVEYTPAQTLDTITDPLSPAAAFSGTSTGFTDGAAAISFTGQSAAVTIASGAFSGVIPALADGEQWPILPATNQTITLTQGANTATLAADIGLPSGYEVTRDGSDNPANFLGIVTNDDTYLGTAFNNAGNPLTENNRAYYEVTARNILIERDGAVSADVGDGPITATVFIPREDGNVYEHEITISESGQLVSVGGLTLRAITMRSLTLRSLTLRQL